MDKEKIIELLKEENIWYEITEHKAVYNMQELEDIELPYKEVDGKNIFLRDDKKRNYYLITVKGDKKINLKEFKEQQNTRPLSFASENELMSIMNLTPGSVTPFGLLNDKDLKVQYFIDKEFLAGTQIIGVHPNENTATVWLKSEDLIGIIKEHGNHIKIIDIV